MPQLTIQQRFKRIAGLASKVERHYFSMKGVATASEQDKAIQRLVDEVKDMSPDVRELLEMDV